MEKFKIGDYVEIIKIYLADEIHKLHCGDIGQISGYSSDKKRYFVSFPRINRTLIMIEPQLKKCEGSTPNPEYPQEMKLKFGDVSNNYIKLTDEGVKINSGCIELNKEKEKNNMEILDLYRERKNFKIKNDFLINKDKILEEDEIQKIFKEMIEQVNTVLENEGSKPINMELPIQYKEFRTKETNEKLNKLEADTDRLKDKLHEDYEEVKALLYMTNDYQEQIKILKNYGIIDKKTNKLSVKLSV